MTKNGGYCCLNLFNRAHEFSMLKEKQNEIKLRSSDNAYLDFLSNIKSKYLDTKIRSVQTVNQNLIDFYCKYVIMLDVLKQLILIITSLNN